MRHNMILMLLIGGFAWSSLAFGQSATHDDVTLDAGGSGSAWLRFEPDGDTLKKFRFWAGSTTGSLDIDGPNDNCIARIFGDSPRNSFTVRGSGFGVGTLSPAESLHVFAGDLSAFSNARVLVENDHSTTVLRTGFELVNNGPSRFELNNTATDQTWAFQTNNSDGFLINRLGSGGNEMSIRKSGQVTMGPAGKINFLLDVPGNLTIDGTLTQNSDRDKKEAFENVDCQQILESVTRLPITSWHYKDDPHGLRHVGPMAQDFHREFQIGKDNKTIATVDADGVALAAIQALNDRIDQLANHLEEKDKQLTAAEHRIAELESVLSENTVPHER